MVIPKAPPIPASVADLFRGRRALRQELLKGTNLVPVRIAILGGSTTGEIETMLELFLLAQGIRPEFHESGYNVYSEEILFENPALWTFKPDIVFIHTTWQNVSAFPQLLEPDAEVEKRLRSELARFGALGKDLHRAWRPDYPEQFRSSEA